MVWGGSPAGGGGSICEKEVRIPLPLAIFPRKVSANGVGPKAGEGHKAYLHLSISLQS